MDSPRLFPWQQEGPPTWGWNHFLAWDPKLQTWRKGSEHQAAHTPLCFSILGSRGPAVSSPYLLRFPRHEKLYLELWGKINPFPLSCPSVLSQKQEKKDTFHIQFLKHFFWDVPTFFFLCGKGNLHISHYRVFTFIILLIQCFNFPTLGYNFSTIILIILTDFQRCPSYFCKRHHDQDNF